MHTRKIMVIRHAEKPASGTPGIMPDGTPEIEALSEAGWRRARALIGLFKPSDGVFASAALATPGTIYASGSKSLRPAQTVTPLAQALGVAVVLAFKKDHEPALVKAARDVGGVVLIAWQHEAIPATARLIRGDGDGIPEIWPSERFDRVWVFDRLESDQWSFTQVAQRILPGDQTGPALSAPLVAATERGAGARFSS